jgi:hypothetical protein
MEAKAFPHMLRNFRIPTFAALLGATFLAATPVSAAPTLSAAECASQAANISVRAVAISQGDTITLYEVYGGFKGQSSIEVFCRRQSDGANLGGIQNAKVQISINPTAAGVTASQFQISAVNGVATTDVGSTHGNPVVVGPFDGNAAIEIAMPAGILPAGVVAQDVGMHFQVVTEGFGSTLTDPLTGSTLHPGTMGDILAQTPELDSLALFGTGVLGMFGYGLTRLRAATRRRDSQG